MFFFPISFPEPKRFNQGDAPADVSVTFTFPSFTKLVDFGNYAKKFGTKTVIGYLPEVELSGSEFLYLSHFFFRFFNWFQSSFSSSPLTKVWKVESAAGPLTQGNTSETERFAIRNETPGTLEASLSSR